MIAMRDSSWDIMTIIIENRGRSIVLPEIFSFKPERNIVLVEAPSCFPLLKQNLCVKPLYKKTRTLDLLKAFDSIDQIYPQRLYWAYFCTCTFVSGWAFLCAMFHYVILRKFKTEPLTFWSFQSHSTLTFIQNSQLT